MAFPNIDVATIKAQLKQAYDANGTDTEFVLRDGAGSFTIPAIQGFRSAEDMTSGLTQNIMRVRILADDWDAASPDRLPQVGDQLTMWDRRHAIENVHVRGINGDKIMYVLNLKG